MAALLTQPLADLTEAAAAIAAGEIAGHLAARNEPAPAREWQDLILGSTPPGQNYTYTVGDAWMWPLSVLCRLTCSAVVADRSLTLEYRDPDGNRFLVAGANTTLAASQQQSFCWQPSAGVGSWPVDDVAVAPLPQQFLRDGFKLVLRLVNGDTADQIDQIRISASFTQIPGASPLS
jgi:hypothetical protein